MDLSEKVHIFVEMVLAFEVLAFEVLAFEVLAFEVLAFEVLVFEVLVFEVLVLDFLKSFISPLFRHSALVNNLKLDESPYFGKNGWGFQPYGKVYTGQWPKLLDCCTVIFSGCLVMKQFLSRNNCYETDENKGCGHT